MKFILFFAAGGLFVFQSLSPSYAASSALQAYAAGCSNPENVN